MRTLGVIPARGSSKRLPRKNLLPIRGVPLIAYMIAAANAATRLDRVVVSTEDAEIAEIARAHGGDVPFRRPDHLAEDYAMDPDILLHAHDTIAEQDGEGFDVIVQLQPTTPFVLPDTIDACVETLITTDANCCFAVRKVSEPPQWMFKIDQNGYARPLLGADVKGEATHTQLLGAAYFPSGAAYAVRTAVLRREAAVMFPPIRVVPMDSLRATDIDEWEDLKLAELIAERHGFGLLKS